MPLSFTPISEKKLWFGSTWTVEDEDSLARLIARVAIGQSRIVEKILRDTNSKTSKYPKSGFKGARELLTVKAGADPYHRDGWMFQVIAWIASHCQDKKALIRPPQMILADKGLDGLIIKFKKGNVAQVVICEEKATKNPRQTVRSEIWPEFERIETGARDNELVATVTALLEKSGNPNPDRVVANILWKNQRAYRTAVTVGDTHNNKSGHKKLFKGYKKIVGGDKSRRRAETLYVVDLRDWMERLAEKAVEIIDAEESSSHV